jgi:hypothetical protein
MHVKERRINLTLIIERRYLGLCHKFLILSPKIQKYFKKEVVKNFIIV